jgi:hypothetical protein
MAFWQKQMDGSGVQNVQNVQNYAEHDSASASTSDFISGSDISSEQEYAEYDNQLNAGSWQTDNVFPNQSPTTKMLTRKDPFNPVTQKAAFHKPSTHLSPYNPSVQNVDPWESSPDTLYEKDDESKDDTFSPSDGDKIVEPELAPEQKSESELPVEITQSKESESSFSFDTKEIEEGQQSDSPRVGESQIEATSLNIAEDLETENSLSRSEDGVVVNDTNNVDNDDDPRKENIEDDNQEDEEKEDDDDGDNHSQKQEENTHANLTVVLQTPTHKTKHSKFVFLSDQKTVPSDLKRLQEKTRRRRRELRNQFHDLECQVGLAASKFAEEKMNLGLAIRDSFDRACCRPLEVAIERVVMEHETSMDQRPAVASLEQKIAQLDNQMMRHIHVTLNDAKREDLDSIRQDFLQEIIPGIRIEKSKTDKIEGGIVRRYELSAGNNARQFHKESAARRASVDMIHRKLQKVIDQEVQRDDTILETIALLREEIKREREERMAADRRIMTDITKTSIAMKRAFLAAFDETN